MNYVPLAEKLRPNQLYDVFGQESILEQGGWLPSSIASQRPLSVLFWGPPGCGKTTLARIYISSFDAETVFFHPATDGIADLKKLLEEKKARPLFSKPLIVFVDEIHRWNRAQQDVLLPFLEKGTFTLIAATTENPSFVLTGALLSRLRVASFTYLHRVALEKIISRALILEKNINISDEVKEFLIEHSKGDGRYLINMLETLSLHPPGTKISLEEAKKLLQKRATLFDRSQDMHFHLISALHKSIRGSDPDAALYWLYRMLEGGEDPLYLARRFIRIASEDIGLADPQALTVCLNAQAAFQTLGSPEGELALAQAAVYLALSPKSNRLYLASKQAKHRAEQTSHFPPPPAICHAPNSFMKNLGLGRHYQNDHDLPQAFSHEHFFPAEMPRETFYQPVERGFEREMKKRTRYFEALRKKRRFENPC
ncbi:MAG: replication-associated recombination protein A [Chlamydiae bacterium]|nr:replication-associated recombination protein A [Chlamydiota bacterium]